MSIECRNGIISFVAGMFMAILLQFWPVLVGVMIVLLVVLVFFFMTTKGEVFKESVICLMDSQSFMVELFDWCAMHRRTVRAKKMSNGCLRCISSPRFSDIILNDDGTITSMDHPSYYFWIPLERNRRMLHLLSKDVPDFDLISKMPLGQRIFAMEEARRKAQSTVS
jgi:hypothetical protein